MVSKSQPSVPHVFPCSTGKSLQVCAQMTPTLSTWVLAPHLPVCPTHPPPQLLHLPRRAHRDTPAVSHWDCWAGAGPLGAPTYGLGRDTAAYQAQGATQQATLSQRPGSKNQFPGGPVTPPNGSRIAIRTETGLPTRHGKQDFFFNCTSARNLFLLIGLLNVNEKTC